MATDTDPDPLMAGQEAVLEVAAGVIQDTASRVLIARRADHRHQGGMWEFPGGKLDCGESPRVALARELGEELGIAVVAADPLITLRHDYPDRRVRLHVWRVTAFSGMPKGLEGQPIRWVKPDELPAYRFPAANRPIVTAARLPDRYAILAPVKPDPGWLERQLASLCLRGIRLVRLRAAHLSLAEYLALGRHVAEYCAKAGIALLVEARAAALLEAGAGGIHLRTDELMALASRPDVSRSGWLGVSCHDAAQLAQAHRVAADFAVLGPVGNTATHPQATPLGWSAFSQLVDAACLPVYALGGLRESDMALAKASGAQGLAAIRAFLA